MLSNVSDDGRLEWVCLSESNEGCGASLSCHIDEVEYRHAGAGAVIALPLCSCGAQCFLKADYSLAELWRETLTVTRSGGEIWAYVLPVPHVQNLRVLWMLYRAGRILEPPVVPLPTAEVAAIESRHKPLLYALWFGHHIVWQYVAVRRLAHTQKQLGHP